MSDAYDLLNQSDGDHAADGAPIPGTGVEWTNTELQSIATTIEDFSADSRWRTGEPSTSANVEASESEIGRLFVEAQRFSEESLSKLELEIHEILCAAEDKARAILTEATHEAIEIRRQAQEAAFLSTKTAQELQSPMPGLPR